jgi:hypothetical protein
VRPCLKQNKNQNGAHKVLEKQAKPQTSRRKEIIKIRNELIKQNQRINQTKSWLFEKISNIDKHFSKLTKREKTQINRLRGEKGMLSQIALKSRGPLGIILKLYTIINWKIWKKWIKI